MPSFNFFPFKKHNWNNTTLYNCALELFMPEFYYQENITTASQGKDSLQGSEQRVKMKSDKVNTTNITKGQIIRWGNNIVSEMALIPSPLNYSPFIDDCGK